MSAVRKPNFDPPSKKTPPKLSLVQGGSGKIQQPNHEKQTVILFLAACGALLAAVIYMATDQKIYLKDIDREFSQLHEVYETGGLEEFKKKKSALHKRVHEILNDGTSSPEAVEAENIAVFLFPDALKEENLEQSEALNLWLPQQKLIEAAPHSIESRIHFEHLRANIWNYENPDKNRPTISKPARQVIRIYDALSKN